MQLCQSSQSPTFVHCTTVWSPWPGPCAGAFNMVCLICLLRLGLGTWRGCHTNNRIAGSCPGLCPGLDIVIGSPVNLKLETAKNTIVQIWVQLICWIKQSQTLKTSNLTDRTNHCCCRLNWLSSSVCDICASFCVPGSSLLEGQAHLGTISPYSQIQRTGIKKYDMPV